MNRNRTPKTTPPRKTGPRPPVTWRFTDWAMI